eukprot:TRINITY_DN3832_c0_g1_i1.p2 TRINITY_DN3832_c0_g1~~TRINITY_DN3832_c0_g1_i1.p2  ORF type:complete len:121 (-),score=33.50 TRINITY_DN3832_c0_g1_i1:41-403(-)
MCIRDRDKAPEGLYIFVMEENGKLLVHPKKDAIKDLNSPKYKVIYDELIKATEDGIWVQYQWDVKKKKKKKKKKNHPSWSPCFYTKINHKKEKKSQESARSLAKNKKIIIHQQTTTTEYA